ncbi:MAG: dockerin type I repeat-containing protein [Clostridia bacterium]|nr:dockerin type I repeat-containing protein [Clostridia bacterium]
MKKFLSIMLSIVILFLSASLTCFAEDDDYDIVIRVAEVITYDKNANGSDGFVGDTTEITAVFRKIERFSSCFVNVDFNKDLLEYETSVEIPVMTCISGCLPTKTGVCFSAKLGDMAIPGKSYSCTATGYLKVKGVGKHDMKISVNVKDAQGNPVDVKVKFVQPYESIIDIAEIDFVEIDDEYMNYSHAVFDREMLVSDVIDLVNNESAVIKNADGKVLSSDDKITTDSRIVTLYEGFEADSLSVCVKHDVNCDGEVTAADARLALRNSAKLEFLNGLMYTAADVDGKSGITAADARLILRKAAQID